MNYCGINQMFRPEYLEHHLGANYGLVCDKTEKLCGVQMGVHDSIWMSSKKLGVDCGREWRK